MLNACDDCRALTSGDCGKHSVGVRDVEMVYANRVTLSATEYRNLLAQIDRLKAALMAAGVPLGTVERIAQFDGGGGADA